MYALYKAVQYVVKSRIPGSLVECGVWRGGSSMVMALTLRKLGREDVDLYLYDTYAGMVAPTDKDVELAGAPAKETWIKHQRASHNEWAYAPLDEVQKNLKSTGYPVERVRFVKGKVEETIPSTNPDRIALLRLDTDWYDSTYHELTYFFPRLSSDGVLIIDDYGFWKGAREATDQYFSENGITLLLNRIDDTGRIAIKIGTRGGAGAESATPPF
jgi:hypothetical protein